MYVNTIVQKSNGFTGSPEILAVAPRGQWTINGSTYVSTFTILGIQSM